MEIDPATLEQKERYKLLIGLVVPRPIAFVSTLSLDGRTNLAPYSFFNGLSSEPLCVLFCPANKADGTEKDTLRNCKPRSEGGAGEFVINASVADYAREIALSAEPLPHGESEFDLTGLAVAPSTRIRTPRVARAPWSLECETVQVVRLAPGAPAGGNVVIGRVLHVHVDDGLIDAKLRIDYAKLGAIGRLGGISYCTTVERFDLPPGLPAAKTR
jgi:flavin reductase (DIM6/NTAB) family NADH-FMN oxidoreductase RutF